MLLYNSLTSEERTTSLVSILLPVGLRQSHGMFPSLKNPNIIIQLTHFRRTYNETGIDTSSSRILVESRGILPSVNKFKYYFITHSLQKNVQ